MSAKRKSLNVAIRDLFVGRYLTPGFMIFAGVGLSVVAFFVVRQWQQEGLNVQLQKRTDNLASSLQKNIDRNFEALLGVSDFYSVSPREVTRQEFNQLSTNILSRHPSIEALGWVPRVTNAQRAAFETVRKAQGEATFQITEQQSQGTMVRAPARAEYFPAAYIAPAGKYDLVVGFNYGSEIRRRSALEQARDTGNAIATSRLDLVSDQPGFLVALPIYQNGVPHNTLLTRRQNLKGFVISIFFLTDFVKTSLTGLDLEDLNVAFYDETPGAAENFLAFYESSRSRVLTEPTDKERLKMNSKLVCPNPTTCTRRLNVGSRQWSLLIVPTPQYLSKNKPWIAWMALASGLILTGCFAIYLLRFQRHTSRVEQLVEKLSEANFEIRSLSRITDSLQACLTLEEAYTVIPRLIQKLFPHHSGGIYAISASGNMVEAATTWGSELSSQLVFSTNDCWAIRCGRAHLFENTHSGLACQHFTQPLPAECFCVPMTAQGENLGLLFLSGSEHGKFTEAKQQLAITVAEHVALSLANLRLRETLKNQSIRDPLTGLFNRRYLEESLERELHRAERQKHSVGIIMLDIDHFKHFNDTFGHEAGDTLLQELAVFLQGSIRGSDVACRYGGEEFTLILPEASLQITQQRAEQLREGVKHLHVQYRRQPLGMVTLSLGVATSPLHGVNASTVVRAADAALYRAKQEGRDRVAIAS
ncbi:diguanylate cyclase [Microcoleus sp. FACHB-672]|uniref:diguanylate cyclase n=1 Tax=Microcoleus sp. FACHB-672 TaxID=2692825 RepID=UPI0016835287|nr:diguanylate cyclase [Microcoleus sp. FACHB-672]MBD2043202.1 diguanylate cyclase [Microcoleus sp. FACHB-672]